VQSQSRDKKEKDNHYPQICEKVQSKRAQFFFVDFKPFTEPWAVGMPQSESDNPVEQGEEHPNREGAQEKVSEENDFFALHGAPVISDGRMRTRLSGLRNLREFVVSMDQLRACESAK
jgi:hypothetical protein